MDFAPYQDTSPETIRALSPPIPGGYRRSQSFSPKIRSPGPQSPAFNGPSSSSPWPPTQAPTAPRGFGSDPEAGFGGLGGARPGLDDFATSLPIRLDYEACLAYLLFPPAIGVFLLIVERKSDYVRFHAWQSSLLFSAMFILQMIFVWSRFMFWLIFLVDLGLIGWLTFRAYTDADTLDRYEVPFFGQLANKFLDDE